MSVELPAIIPLRDPWPKETMQQWSSLAARARRITNRVADVITGDRRDELARLLRDGDLDAVRMRLADGAYVVAIAMLWSEPDGELRDSISPELLDLIRDHHSRIPRLARAELISTFFVRFDALGDGAEGETTTRMAFDALAELLAREADSPDVRALFDREAPERLAAKLLDAGVEIQGAIRDLGLARYRGGRFLELLDNELYLERLRRIPLGDDAPVLEEVRDERVYRAPHRFGRMLGHQALEILIDRVGDEAPTPRWRDLVLEIAGDPRQTHGEQYATWWSVLGAERAAVVAAWVARTETEVFLEYLREVARSDEAMDRLFPPRKHLLEGLLRSGIVRRSRLILAPDVQRQLRAVLPPGSISVSARLLGGASRMRAMIYLDCGDFHLIEGSHNTRLFLYMGVPAAKLINPQVRSFEYEELTKHIPDQFARRWRAHRNAPLAGVEDVWHQGLWQRKVVEFVRARGIDVDPRSVMDANAYRTLVLRNEIPPLSNVRLEPLRVEEQ